MRNTDCGGNTSWIVALSSCAVSRFEPKGFSTTTRRQLPGTGWARPCSFSWPITSGKNLGGIER